MKKLNKLLKLTFIGVFLLISKASYSGYDNGTKGFFLNGSTFVSVQQEEYISDSTLIHLESDSYVHFNTSARVVIDSRVPVGSRISFVMQGIIEGPRTAYSSEIRVDEFKTIDGQSQAFPLTFSLPISGMKSAGDYKAYWKLRFIDYTFDNVANIEFHDAIVSVFPAHED